MLIEIHIDLICPWCLIGKRRLDRALAQRPDLAVDIAWAPFQLNPDMPRAGMNRAQYLSMKFGGPDRAAQVYRMIEQVARRDGLDLRFDLIRRTPNTVDAHRLIRLADGYGLATAMVEALFDAYFIRGLDIGDHATLAGIAGGIGLDPDATAAYLDEGTDSAAIRSVDQQSRRLGIQAVPFFIFDRRYSVAGAQEVETFLPFLDLAGGSGMPGLGVA